MEGVAENADTKASEAVLCPLEAFYYGYFITYLKNRKRREVKMKLRKSSRIKDRGIKLKPDVILTCFLFILIVISFSAQSHAELSIYFSESAFVSTAPIVSTETFDSFSTGSGFDETEVVIDDVIYIADEGQGSCEPLPCWRFADGLSDGPLPVTPPNYLLSNQISKDVISFGSNKICKAFGFYFHSAISADWLNEYQPDFLGWEIIVKEADGKTLSINIDPDIVGSENTEPPYFGFDSTVGIKEIVIGDIEGNGSGVNWAYDNVSRSEIEIETLSVNIDIKPSSYPNSINPKSKGKIPVAILSTMDFYAPAEVDLETLTFGRNGDEDSLAFCNSSPEDVNDDGEEDLVCHFNTQEAGFECGDSEGFLRVQIVDETPIAIEGSDSVRIVPSACKDQNEAKKGKKK